MAAVKRPILDRNLRRLFSTEQSAALAAALDRTADALLFQGKHAEAERLAHEAAAMRAEALR